MYEDVTETVLGAAKTVANVQYSVGHGAHHAFAYFSPGVCEIRVFCDYNGQLYRLTALYTENPRTAYVHPLYVMEGANFGPKREIYVPAPYLALSDAVSELSYAFRVVSSEFSSAIDRINFHATFCDQVALLTKKYHHIVLGYQNPAK